MKEIIANETGGHKRLILGSVAEIAEELEGFTTEGQFEILDRVRTGICEAIFDETELSAQVVQEACEQGNNVVYESSIYYERRKYTILIKVENADANEHDIQQLLLNANRR